MNFIGSLLHRFEPRGELDRGVAVRFDDLDTVYMQV